MNYRDVYFSRVNHMGETMQERILNGGMRSFMKWLAEAPETVRGLSVERGIYFDGIIEENKDKEHKKIMFLHVSNDTPLVVGDIMNWTTNSGILEKWLIHQEEKKTNPPYRTFWIIRCNYLLRWVNQEGHVEQSWSYLTSSLDSMIKGNYRTWNNLISPQPNKYAEALMPRKEIFRSTNFIVEKESWSLVDYDYTSVPGTIYLSLTEGKVNSLTDDLVNNIADTDKIADYKIIQSEDIQKFEKDTYISPTFSLLKNGKECNENVFFNISDNKIARYDDTGIKAIKAGFVTLIARVKDRTEPIGTIEIEVVNSMDEPQVLYYIEGAEKVKLDRNSTYTLHGSDSEVIFSIDDTTYATIISSSNNSCVIHTNNNNLLGTFVLNAEINGVTYSKQIQVIPLW